MKIRNILLTSLLAITSAFTTKALVKENTSIVRSSSDTYYTNVDTSSGSNLIDSLESIISKGTKDVGYDGLWSAYKKQMLSLILILFGICILMKIMTLIEIMVVITQRKEICSIVSTLFPKAGLIRNLQ